MLSGIFIVLLFYALGEFVAWLIHGFVPGSVIGMVLLFTALCLKWVKPGQIKPVARFLCDNMAPFFYSCRGWYCKCLGYFIEILAGDISGLRGKYGDHYCDRRFYTAVL